MQDSLTALSPMERWEHLSILVDMEGFEMFEIWSSDALNTMVGVWRSGKAIIGRIERPFHVVYRVRDNSPPGSETYTALANIEMSGCHEYVRKDPCARPPNYRCANGNCIFRTQVCDYVDNCGDGSDELNVVCTQYKDRCDFENGLCDWGRYGLGDWKIGRGLASLVLGPTRDHTKGLL